MNLHIATRKNRCVTDACKERIYILCDGEIGYRAFQIPFGSALFCKKDMKGLSVEDSTNETNLHTIAPSKLYHSIQSVWHLHVSAVSSDAPATIHDDEF